MPAQEIKETTFCFPLQLRMWGIRYLAFTWCLYDQNAVLALPNQTVQHPSATCMAFNSLMGQQMGKTVFWPTVLFSGSPISLPSTYFSKPIYAKGTVCRCWRGNFVSRDLFLCKLISIARKKHLLTSMKEKVFPEFSDHIPIPASCGVEICVWSPHDRGTDLLCSVYSKN